MSKHHKTKSYTKDKTDWMGNFKISTSNQEVDAKKYGASPLWCKVCGFGTRACKCPKLNKQTDE